MATVLFRIETVLLGTETGSEVICVLACLDYAVIYTVLYLE